MKKKQIIQIAALFLISLLLGCTNSKYTSQNQSEVSDSLDDCIERTRIGDYIQEVDTCTLSYSSAILRDTLGRFVAESVSDGHGESYISFFYDKQGLVSDIYLGEGYSSESYDAEQEVKFLTDSCRNDKDAIVFTLERDSYGKIVQVRSPKSNDKIFCSPGGEITYTIIRNPGWVSNISELYQGGFLNVEFLLRSPKDNRGNWEETNYLGYHKTQYRKYENNKPAKAEAISLVNSKILKKVNFAYSGDTLTILSENLKDTLFENKVFVGNQLLSYIKKSRWGTILEKKNYEVTESGEVVCHSENYDFSTKALKSISPYNVKQEDIDLTECLKNIFEDL
jgi:hypothetical protein